MTDLMSAPQLQLNSSDPVIFGLVLLVLLSLYLRLPTNGFKSQNSSSSKFIAFLKSSVRSFWIGSILFNLVECCSSRMKSSSHPISTVSSTICSSSSISRRETSTFKGSIDNVTSPMLSHFEMIDKSLSMTSSSSPLVLIGLFISAKTETSRFSLEAAASLSNISLLTALPCCCSISTSRNMAGASIARASSIVFSTGELMVSCVNDAFLVFAG
mmetsp:Transcript_28884/g.60071  ORF Transcript_28884/g.60071 Transcript_28884/m.60071 type:complete len:214 (-) Transcript_28884:1136-1777(-)